MFGGGGFGLGRCSGYGGLASVRLIEDVLERVDFRNLLPSVFALHEYLDVILDGAVFDKLRDFPIGVGALRLGTDREIKLLTVVGACAACGWGVCS